MKRAALVTTLTQTYKLCDVTFGVFLLPGGNLTAEKSLSFVILTNCFVSFFNGIIIPVLIDLVEL